jgi:hypothetical protein
MDPVGDDVRAELQRLGGESGAAADTTDAWVAAVGAEIARNAWPARTQADGTLVVHVRDAIWGPAPLRPRSAARRDVSAGRSTAA